MPSVCIPAAVNRKYP